jgi:hypothetical protein
MEERIPRELGLRAGDWVRVRSAEEILSTLDDRGRLDGMPFMPEMLAFCGKRFRVYKAAHKTCNTIDKVGPPARRMKETVHLEGLRCSGEAHGGCQAACLLYWKHAWLEPAPDENGRAPRRRARARAADRPQVCTEERLREGTRASDGAAGADAPTRYACQATEVKRASEPLSDWDFRQYFRDLFSGNVRLREMPGPLLHWLFTKSSKLGAYRLQRKLYDAVAPRCGSMPYAGDVKGAHTGRTPTGRLDLRPGETVEVLSHAEIAQTLDQNSRNRGLWFDEEMVPYCGQQGRVLARVDRIINEATGEMMEFSNPCIILEGIFCRARFTRGRYFCPRSIYSYWREIWLRRTDPAATDAES